jgi:hypothetical protein
MNDLLSTIKGISLPTVFVWAGIAFWVLAIAGSLAGKITVEPGKQKIAGVVGSVFIVLGLVLDYFPIRDIPEPTPNPAPSTGPPSREKTLPPPENRTSASPSFDCAPGSANEYSVSCLKRPIR